jgi:hypothetical protein
MLMGILHFVLIAAFIYFGICLLGWVLGAIAHTILPVSFGIKKVKADEELS